MPIRPVVAVATVMIWVLGAGEVQAASIEWRAPAGCPDAAGLRARIERRLDTSLDDVAIDISIDVSRSRGQFVARIDLGALTASDDVRTLTSRRCSELADAVAVIVARVANDAARRAAEIREVDVNAIVIHPVSAAPASPLGPPRAERHDEPTHTDGPALAAAGKTFRPWTIGARMSGISGIGVLPKVGLGGELAVTVRAGTHLAELGAARWVMSVAQFHDGAPAKVEVDLDVTVARYGWRPPNLPLRAWVAVEVGNMHGDGIDLPGTLIESGRWIAAGTGFGIAWQMTPWVRLFGGTEAMLAVERVRFSMGDMTVYAPSPMSVRTTCGLEVGWQ